MSTTQHTGHYNLPTFGDNPNDRPSWRGDFTDAMTKIDNQMYANATNIVTATAVVFFVCVGDEVCGFAAFCRCYHLFDCFLGLG